MVCSLRVPVVEGYGVQGGDGGFSELKVRLWGLGARVEGEASLDVVRLLPKDSNVVLFWVCHDFLVADCNVRPKPQLCSGLEGREAMDATATAPRGPTPIQSGTATVLD